VQCKDYGSRKPAYPPNKNPSASTKLLFHETVAANGCGTVSRMRPAHSYCEVIPVTVYDSLLSASSSSSPRAPSSSLHKYNPPFPIQSYL
jgi:hypothetical protein